MARRNRPPASPPSSGGRRRPPEIPRTWSPLASPLPGPASGPALEQGLLVRLLAAIDLHDLGLFDWHLPSGRVVYSQPLAKAPDRKLVFHETRADEWFDVAHPEDLPMAAGAVERALRGETDRFSQYYRRRFERGWLYVRSDGMVVERDSGGRPVRVVGTFRDVTEPVAIDRDRHSREASVRHALLRATLAEFATGLAHELSQPLTALSGNVQAALRLLAEGRPVDTEARQALERSVHLAERAADIVRSMRQLVRSAPGADQGFDLRTLAREVGDLLRPEAERSDVAIDVDASPRPVTVIADRGQIEQVLVNLVRNAVEAIGPTDATRRRVSLKVLSGRPRTSIVVEDTGPGISAEVRERIFQPYFTTKPTGTGLGLRICRTIAEAHGGRLVCDPGEPGRGARFTLDLPSGRPASGKRAPGRAPRPQGPGARRG